MIEVKPFSSGSRMPPAQWDELTRTYRLGWSAEQIAKAMNRRFGTAFTRNAIIGHIHRHIPAEERHQRPAALPRAVKAPRPIRKIEPAQKTPVLKLAGRGTVFEEATPAPPRVIVGGKAFEPLPGSTPVAFLDRHGAQCRWPIHVEPDEHHCCGRRAENGPYSDTHADISRSRDTRVTTGKELARSLRRYA